MFDPRLVWVTVAITAVAAGYAVIVEDEAGAALPVLGLLIVAIFTAAAAEFRQRQQLEAEGKRQARALDAEGERHGATLAHERQRDELADLRAILDDGAVALHRLHDAIRRLQTACNTWGSGVHRREAERRTELRRTAEEVNSMSARLSVRIGADPAVTALDAATEPAVALYNRTRPGGADEHEEALQYLAAIDAEEKRFRECAHKFMNRAVELAGNRSGSNPSGPEANQP